MENKWFIKITEENKHILMPYWKTLVSKRVLTDYEFKGWFCGWRWDKTYLCYSIRPPIKVGRGQHQITLEEFQRDILGQNIESSYEIY